MFVEVMITEYHMVLNGFHNYYSNVLLLLLLCIQILMNAAH